MYLLPIFAGLAALFGLLLLVGFVWILVGSGTTTRRQEENVGKDIMAEQLGTEWETPVASKNAYKGNAASTEREVAVSFRDTKSQIRSGQWRQALPILLAVGGFLGFLLFGSLALMVALDNKLVGGFMAVTAAYSVVRVLIGMIQA